MNNKLNLFRDFMKLIVPPLPAFSGERVQIEEGLDYQRGDLPKQAKSLPLSVLVHQDLLNSLMGARKLLEPDQARVAEGEGFMETPFNQTLFPGWSLRVVPSPAPKFGDFLGIVMGDGVIASISPSLYQMQRSVVSSGLGLPLHKSGVLRVATPEWVWINPEGPVV